MKHTFVYFLLFSINIMGMVTSELDLKTAIADALPYEICKYIDVLYAQITNDELEKKIQRSYTEPWNTFYRQTKEHPLVISNNGHYYAHSFANNSHLVCTGKKDVIKIETGYTSPIHFSPDNTYCVVKSYDDTYFYNLINKNKHSLNGKEKSSCLGITISNNSQYILLEGRHKIQQSKPIYFLWTLNETGEPYKIDSKNLLLYSFATIFHPNNQYIIHNSWYDELRLYNIATSEDIVISPEKNNNAYLLDKLTITADNKTILATTQPKEIDTQPDYILFNIENLDKVTSTTLAPQSCHEMANLPVLAIPHKQMLTHITNKGCTLQLVDHNQKHIVTHQTTDETYITALTVDAMGNYLAIGHSDGTIIIWNICSSDQAYYEKTYIKSNDSIKSLTLTDNQLLLSQSASTDIDSTVYLWDIYGNKIMHFGNSNINSIISPNGKTINIVCGFTDQKPFNQYVAMLTTYYLTDETLSLLNNKPNLAQLSRLINQ